MIFLALAILAAAWLAYGLWLPLSPSGQRFVLVRPGASTGRIALDLRHAGVIRSATAFLLMHYARGAVKLQAGEYLFEQPANAFAVHDRIHRGDVYVHTLVIPEGFNIFDIANAMAAGGLASREEFLEAARSDVNLIADLDPEAKSLEGYLFPDTYAVSRTQTLYEVLAMMVKRFRQEARALDLDSGFQRIVTIASIVEKETAVPKERPLVSSVLENRLAQRIPLSADPSVIYAGLLVGRYHGVIHESDLQFDSPYNTYKHTGLPPGPISNPGRSALEAAMRPARTSYLYFVSDNQGHHRFAHSLEEHQRNVAAYRHAQAANR